MTTKEYGEVTAQQDATQLTSKMGKRTTSQGVQLQELEKTRKQFSPRASPPKEYEPADSMV